MSKQGPFVITGPVGGAPNRLEINDFVKDEVTFSLYIQALTVMSKESQDELLSFFQIGGIHGLPYIPWNGSGNKDVGQWGGYCTHGNVLFPTWHRPYVAVYEQLLQRHAIEIAKTYTVDHERWRQAALNMRTPYWDWARHAVPPKEVASLDEVEIIAHNGSKVKVINPLKRYAFHPIDPSFPPPYDQWKTTLRHPEPQSGPNSKTDVAEMEQTLQSNYQSIRTSLYAMFRSIHNWLDFSNHTPAPGKPVANSLESIHDNIHGFVGGAGHMGDPAVAGFDPIFFLHHANVDRLLALWSAVNPGVWVVDGDSEQGTWTIPADSTVGIKTDLTPFWNAETTYWESSEVTTTAKFGYSYPEFNGLDMGNPEAVKRAITRKINQLYGDFGLSSSSSSQQTAPQAPISIASTPSAPSDNGSYLDWTARVHVKKYEVGGSFSVLLFIGEVPEDPSQWYTAPSFAGAHSAFVNSAAAQCENCTRQQEAGVVTEGFIHLNNALKRVLPGGSFDDKVVVPVLKEKLHWRVRKLTGEVVDLSKVPSLEITVFHIKLSHHVPDESTLPTHGDPTFHHHVTAGRPGGSRSA